MRRWAPAGLAVAVVVIVVVAALNATVGGSGSTTATSTTTTGVVNSATSTTFPAVTVQTDPTVARTQLSAALHKGSSGDEVKLVQQRLADLGFSPGPIDGDFGGGTEQAVWAFEKLVMQTPRSQVTSTVTNDMWQMMQSKLLIAALRPSGVGTTHVEVYIPQQVLIVFTNDAPKLIAHISSGMQKPDGSADHFCDYADFNTDTQGVPLPATVTKYVCADTKTPGGVFKVDHELAGDHVGPLGGMFNPVYFNYGIAIHGAMNVPKLPVSHGCVRLNETIAAFFPQLVGKGDTVYVWAQDGKQPEEYTTDESYPSFNAVTDDPNATTTSTTVVPTSTTPTSTTGSTTTSLDQTSTTVKAKPPTTTTAPAPTTVVETTTTPPSTTVTA